MNILVVHDRPEVGDRIVSLLEKYEDDIRVTYCADGSTARRHLSEVYFDLLILDLTIPMVVGPANSANATLTVAEGLLEELMQSDNLMTPGNTVGITQDPEALATIANGIGPHLMAIIAERGDAAWEAQLLDRVKYVYNSLTARATAYLSRYDYDALIMTALDEELAPFFELLELLDHPRIDGLKTFLFTDKNGLLRRGACFAIGRAGQPSSASETQGLLCQLRPRVAIMTGFCGGIPSKTELGEVLLAESSIDWDYGKWKPTKNVSKLYSRPEPVGIRNSKVHRIARKFVLSGIPNIDALNEKTAFLSSGEVMAVSARLTPFASGSAVIGDPEIVSSVRDLNDAIGGVDMESFGFYYACRHAHSAKPEFICVKSVADHCGPDKDDRLHAACSFASAFTALQILALWDFQS